ncbi:MAG: hypothetical protein R3F65_03490 [bacterium]
MREDLFDAGFDDLAEQGAFDLAALAAADARDLDAFVGVEAGNRRARSRGSAWCSASTLVLRQPLMSWVTCHPPTASMAEVYELAAFGGTATSVGSNARNVDEVLT